MMRRAALSLALVACAKDPPAPPAPRGLALSVLIDGKSETWGQDVFTRVPHFAARNKDGKDRDAWSLCDFAKVVGPTARVTAVVGDPRLVIDAGTWADASRIPIIHRTGRGGIKFRWTDAAGTWNDADVKDVTGLELTRGER